MNVLHINALYGTGSTGLIVKDISETITPFGYESFFAYQRTIENVKNGYQIGNALDWKLHSVLCRVLGKQGYYSFSSTKKLLKHITEIKPDIVHLHNLHSNYIHLNLLLDFLGKNDIATVITMHDCWYFTGKCFHYVDANCNNFISGCKNCPKKQAPPRSIFFDQAEKVLKDRQKYLSAIPKLKIVGCSDWICNEAKKGILRNLDITRIYNGVDTDIFKTYDAQHLKEKYNLKGKFIILGMANKWLLPSNKLVLDKVSEILDDNTKLILLGCTEEQIKLIQKQNNNIIAIGFISDRKELALHYNLADVFVNVTHADTLPTVNMESICCGTPVITYDSCGSPELVADGCGIVIKENDVDGIINALCSIKENNNFNCAQIGRDLYNKNNCYKKYIDIYKSILKLER
jgi:glycosyltransferase involved in cell wall biosynthesis